MVSRFSPPGWPSWTLRSPERPLAEVCFLPRAGPWPQELTSVPPDLLEVPLDITYNGMVPMPPYDDDDPSCFYGISMFLYSYDTGLNLTITDGGDDEDAKAVYRNAKGAHGVTKGTKSNTQGTSNSGTAKTATKPKISSHNTGTHKKDADGDDDGYGDYYGYDPLLIEPGSSVKHIRFMWPDCLEGDSKNDNPARGHYNISIQQSFRFNGYDYYTVFDLPISVSNSIPHNPNRPSCDILNNPLLPPELIAIGSDNKRVMTMLSKKGKGNFLQKPTGTPDREPANWKLSPVAPGAAPADPDDDVADDYYDNDQDDGVRIAVGAGGRLDWRRAAYWISALAMLAITVL